MIRTFFLFSNTLTTILPEWSLGYFTVQAVTQNFIRYTFFFKLLMKLLPEAAIDKC